MKTVREIFRTRAKEGDVGIEIEVEGDNIPYIDSEYWRSEHDGSLRGRSMEYVLVEPLALPDAYKALVNLQQRFRANETKVHDTGRAGVHVHVNCQALNIIQLYNFMTLYTIFEDVLVEWCGPDRVGNLFCLRSKDAEYLLYALGLALETRDWRGLFGTDDLRYASMNVKALCSYGSLEFRSMRSTDDMDTIYLWASSLVGLREAAKQVENPTELIYQVSAGGEEAFLDNYLPDLADTIKEQKDWKASIRDGMRRAQEIAFAGDWEALAKLPKKLVGGIKVDHNWEDDFPPMDV